MVKKVMALVDKATALDAILQVHVFLLKTSLDHNIFVLAKFLRCCVECTSPQALLHGRDVFDQIRHPDVFLWNTLMRAYLLAQNPGESLCLFRQMCWGSGGVLAADSFTLSLCLQACGRSEELGTGVAIHANVVKLGFVSDLFVQTALMEMYAKSSDIRTARRVFDDTPNRDLVMFNAMLGEYVNRGDILQASHLFDAMPERDLYSWNTMIHGFSVSGDLGCAREVFDKMNERDVISWSSIISAYVQSRKPNVALRLFQDMQKHRAVPDNVTMVSVLSACGDMGALGMGKAVHRLIIKSGIQVDVKLGTSLVEMYARCGDIDNSLLAFCSMSAKDSLTWSAMILGLANHGLAIDAMELFSKMISEGVKPHDTAFVGVLSACNHAGHVGEGKAHFDSMSKIYGITPKMEHYGCMVDLLGRSGHIEEARMVIVSMPFEPDAVVWRALLGGCLIHKNVDVAEEAIVNLINLQPHVDGHYVLLSNIYAGEKRWDDIAELRRRMRSQRIIKVPGSSSIELENELYEFVAGDRSHPKTIEIYNMLEEIVGQLRKAGYEPKETLDLQDHEQF
ncbi:hypothetical protein HPP92_012768 [Vanilla planifolia]|uniref:Chlororespiratory reduction 4 n=1 Tax=Vanilla planifolia TaxID=51239 RepID=A0A835UVV0_VANPL|nr:hypothetical protein HPP92_012768 [Vanilla planifolia]